MAKTGIVTTRHVTITSPSGDRLKKAMWSQPRAWRRARNIATNLRRAIAYAKEVLAKKRIGTVVYVGDAPVYHCKWGGERGFMGWKNNPVAEWWRRRLR